MKLFCLPAAGDPTDHSGWPRQGRGAVGSQRSHEEPEDPPGAADLLSGEQLSGKSFSLDLNPQRFNLSNTILRLKPRFYTFSLLILKRNNLLTFRALLWWFLSFCVSPELFLQYGPVAVPRRAGQHKLQGRWQEEHVGSDRWVSLMLTAHRREGNSNIDHKFKTILFCPKLNVSFLH